MPAIYIGKTKTKLNGTILLVGSPCIKCLDSTDFSNFADRPLLFDGKFQEIHGYLSNLGKPYYFMDSFKNKLILQVFFQIWGNPTI